MKKLVLSMILVLSIFYSTCFITVSANEVVYAHINGHRVTASGYYNADGSPASESDYKYAYDVDTKTMTLNNMTITKCTSCSRGGYPYVAGIYLPKDATLYLIGNNVIELDVDKDTTKYQCERVGVSCTRDILGDGNFTIAGDGNLNISTKDWKVTSNSYIFAENVWSGIVGHVTKTGSETVTIQQFDFSVDGQGIAGDLQSYGINGNLMLNQGTININTPSIHSAQKMEIKSFGVSGDIARIEPDAFLNVNMGDVCVPEGNVYVYGLAFPWSSQDKVFKGTVNIKTANVQISDFGSIENYGVTGYRHALKIDSANFSCETGDLSLLRTFDSNDYSVRSIGCDANLYLYGDAKVKLAVGDIKALGCKNVVVRAYSPSSNTIVTRPDLNCKHTIEGITFDGQSVLSPETYENYAELHISQNEIPVIYGDANGDGNINMLDVLLIRKYIAKQPVSPNLQASDVTHDGDVNMLDVLKIRKYIAKQPVDLNKM